MYDKRIAEPEFAALTEKKRKKLKNANTVVGGFGCLGTFLGFFWLAATAGIALCFGIPALIICLFVIPAVFRMYAKTGTHRRLLHLMRAFGIALLAAVWLAPLICTRFERVLLLYPVKHFVYQVGVRAYPYKDTHFPAFLPRKHDSYLLRTEPGMVAQDYHAGEYLFLHTDKETLRSFEERISGDPALVRTENRSYTQDAVGRMIENGEIPDAEWTEYQNIPYRMYSMIREYAEIEDDLTHAAVYRTERGGSGVLLNYETGLLVIWD